MVIIVLAPYPIGVWLGHRYPHIERCVTRFRAPSLALASIVMAIEIQRHELPASLFDSIWAGFIGVVSMLLVDGICLLFLVRIAQPMLLKAYVQSLPELNSFSSKVRFTLSNATSSVWEELVFRYVPYALFGSLWWGYTFAALLSSGVFGMQHARQGFRQVAYSFAIGLFFCFLVWSTGSVWASICAHFAGNTFTALVARRSMQRSLQGYVAPF